MRVACAVYFVFTVFTGVFFYARSPQCILRSRNMRRKTGKQNKYSTLVVPTLRRPLDTNDSDREGTFCTSCQPVFPRSGAIVDRRCRSGRMPKEVHLYIHIYGVPWKMPPPPSFCTFGTSAGIVHEFFCVPPLTVSSRVRNKIGVTFRAAKNFHESLDSAFRRPLKQP